MFGSFQTSNVGPYERDPRVMPITALLSGTLNTVDAGGPLNPATGNTFWDIHVSRMGSVQTADPSTATRTILNVTGRGRLVGVIGPGVASGAQTTTFTITADGQVFTITVPTNEAASNFRACLGDFYRHATEATAANIVAGSTGWAGRQSTIITRTQWSGDTFVIRQPTHAARFLKFDAALKIEVACTALGAGGRDSSAGAIWNLDG